MIRSSFEMKPEHRQMLIELGEEMIRQGSNGFEFVVRDKGDVVLVIDMLRLIHADV